MGYRQSHRPSPVLLLTCLAGIACMLATHLPGADADPPEPPRIAPGAAGQAADIRGPIGPVGIPEEPRSPWGRRARGGLLATAFAVVALGFLVRRRRRARGLARPVRALDALRLEDDLAHLPADEFYEELLGVVRKALDQVPGRPTAALTPRELAALDVRLWSEDDASERWRHLCARAERAEYGGVAVGRTGRQADLQLVRGLLERLRRAQGETADAV